MLFLTPPLLFPCWWEGNAMGLEITYLQKWSLVFTKMIINIHNTGSYLVHNSLDIAITLKHDWIKKNNLVPESQRCHRFVSFSLGSVITGNGFAKAMAYAWCRSFPSFLPPHRTQTSKGKLQQALLWDKGETHKCREDALWMEWDSLAIAMYASLFSFKEKL